MNKHFNCNDILYIYITVRALTVGVVNVPNAKYLAHLPHQTQKTPNIRCAKSHHFYNMWTVPLQICNGIEWCGISFNHFLFFFSLLSLHFSSSDITPLHSFLLSLFFLLNLVVFLSDITLSFFFSPFSSFTPISVAVVLFYFFFAMIWYPGRQWVGWDGDWWITGGGLRWSDSVVGGSAGDGRIGGNGFCCAKSVVRNRWMGSKSVNCWCEIGEWVPNRRNRWCEIGEWVLNWRNRWMGCGRNNFSGVVGGWVVGFVVFLVVVAATIFLVMVFFFF